MRIYDKKINIDKNNVKDFWYNRAKTSSGCEAVLLSADKKGAAALRDKIECAKLLDTIDKNKKIRVLDLGCGVARFAHVLGDFIDVYHGIDFCDDFILKNKDAFANDNRYDFFCADITNLKGIELLEKYDLITITGVLMYINDNELSQVLELVNEKLQIGGGLLYLIETCSIMQNRLSLDGFYSKELKSKYFVIYRTDKEYNQILEKYFQNISIEYILDEKSGKRDETNACTFICKR